MRIVEHIQLAALLTLLFLIVFSLACRGETDNVSTNADYVAGENSQIILTPELRAVASQMMGGNADALLHAVSLTMQKYDNDMVTQNGRRSWHGRFIREEISTNALCKVEVYSNEVTGAIWRYRTPFKPKPFVAARTAAAYVASTNGVPARLAAIRAKRAAQLNAGIVTTNVVVNATGK